MTASGRPTDEEAVSPEQNANVSHWLVEHGDAMYRYARARVGRRELAEDLVQETFLAAVQSREPFRCESSLRTWLIAILRRKIVDHYRRHPRAVDGEAQSIQATPEYAQLFTSAGSWRQLPAVWKSPGDALENREFWVVLGTCLSKLPSSLARTFLLRELVGVEMDELRETQVLSGVNVRVRLHRARVLLRECLERNWFGEPIHKRTRSP
jgi:RNA polymerase sigma-70 factor (ECF subfamily)